MVFVLLNPLWVRALHAEASEVQVLRQEVQELKKAVQQLSEVVQKQNAKIEQLAAGQAPINDKEVASETSPLVPTMATLPETKETQVGSTGEDQEIQNLLGTLDNSKPAPGSQSASIGFWKVPTGSGLAAKLIPDISAIATFAGAYFSSEPMGETGHNPARTGFTFQELELALQSVIDPYFRYDIFLSFHEEGVELEEAYFTTLWGPRGLQFKGGKFLQPFGRQNQKHLEQWSFADDNLVNQYLLGPEALDELGLETSYLFPTPFFLKLQGTFTNGDNEDSFGGEGKGEFLYLGRLSGSADINDELTVLAGASSAFGYNNTAPGNQTLLVGSDFLLKWKPSAYRSLTWQTEFIARRMEVPFAAEWDGGLYSYIDYQFLKRWHLGFRYDQMGIPEGLVASEFRVTPAITFNPTEFSRIRLQYEYDKISELVGSHAAMLQFQFSMGPHGAHPF